ncbi:hypothetical protein M3B90_06670 [Dermabacter sp. p3-SID358]|uniref:hypothetical protein n=1 Tax=Dermabacter sp. p3-SID358 TaxID=2916114 RepID=UPI0021A4B36B|nr:hypothetical protein [Dermabacter sp. p3-SID358]MCT1867204.1 hypothetical protein [Dermabacter sp. p3-SID358]
MTRPTSTVPLFRPRTWVSGLAALALVGALGGCGALSAREQEKSDASSTSADSSAGAENPGSSSRGGTGKAPAGRPGEQETGDVNDPATWILRPENTFIDGVDDYDLKTSIEDSSDRDFTLQFALGDEAAQIPECAEVSQKIDSFHGTIAQGAVATYKGDIDPVTPGEDVKINAAAVILDEETDVMTLYSEAAKACGDIGGKFDVSVEQVYDLDVVHIEAVGKHFYIGGRSAGKAQLFLYVQGVEESQAVAFIKAQVDLFDRSVGSAG